MSLFGKKPEPKPKPSSRVEAPPPALPPAAPRFGIDQAVGLLKTLPVEESESLVLYVIKNTLASLRVDVDEVIDDGKAKQERLATRIAELRSVIAELESQVDVHRAEIATVELDLAETTAARERLELAKRVDNPSAGPPVAPVPPPPKRNRSGRPPSFPKPPPRKLDTAPPEADKPDPRTAATKPEVRPVPEPDNGPESDLFGMLPDDPKT